MTFESRPYDLLTPPAAASEEIAARKKRGQPADAEIALVAMGTTVSTARRAADEARERGVRAGVVQVRMFRPFPEAALRAALRFDRVEL